MATLLRIDVSPRGAQSHSRRFADELVQVLAGKGGLLRTIVRDLGAGPAVSIDADYVRAMHAHATPAPAEGVPQLALSEQLIGELETSDVVLISTPVHNYTVPASLKAWIDKVVRIGRTFKSTPQGKVGSLADRPTYVVAASGGYFSDGPTRQPDFFTPYLDAILATIGIRDVHHVRLQGLARGDAAVALAYAEARKTLDGLRLPQRQ
jgi:FMN-dependent NADH-azoreductase